MSESDYAHETLARVLPLRDAFVALFFATLGALIDPRVALSNLPLLAVMIGLVLVGKLVLWTGVVTLFGYPLWTALLVGVGLTQIGEFSFILVQAARDAGLVGADVYNATLATALVTILANAALVRFAPRWLSRAAPDRALGQIDGPRDGGDAHVVLCGFGRIGSAVGEALETFGVRYVAVETDPDVVRALRARGVPCLYGDAAHPHLLEAAGVADAALVVMTVPDADHARLAVARIRAINPRVPILARAHRRDIGDSLRAAGATVVVEPELEAAATFIRHALHHLALPDERLTVYLERFREAMSAGQPAAPGVRARPPGGARGAAPRRAPRWRHAAGRSHPGALRRDRRGDHAPRRLPRRQPAGQHHPASGRPPAGVRAPGPDRRAGHGQRRRGGRSSMNGGMPHDALAATRELEKRASSCRTS